MRYKVQGYRGSEIVEQDIDPKTFQPIKKAKETCFLALEIEERFALLFDNFAEFEVELLRLAEFLLLWSNRVQDFTNSMQQRLLLDRRLVNLLTSCRLYHDHTDHGLSQLFGKSSAELTSIKKFKKELYSSYRGYRLMEALRNHVQHFGLAAQSITWNFVRSEGKGGPDYMEFSVYPQASLTILAENRKFRKNVLMEMQEDGEQIDLRGPLREYMSCFVVLHSKLRDVISQEAENARKLFESAIRGSFFDVRDQDVKYSSLLELSETGELIGEIPLATNFLNYYDNLRKRNSVNTKINRSAATNTDQKKK